MRILFMGTPDFAATVLSSLIASRHEVVGVVTGKDKPRDRGHATQGTPVRKLAEENGIPVLTPDTLRDEAFREALAGFDVDVIVVAAYGKILPKNVLDAPRYGCVNAHASLLPKYRGAAPIQRCLMDGEKETGVTAMLMAEGLDTGDILLQKKTPISLQDDFETLHDRLAALGGQAVLEALDRLEDGTAVPVAQNEAEASYASKIEKEDRVLDFSKDAEKLSCVIRALSPFPLAMTTKDDGKILKIVSAEPRPGDVASRPGEVVFGPGRRVLIQTGSGHLELKTAIPEGKGRMTGADLINGRKIREGEILGL